MYYKPISPRLTPTGRYSQQSTDRRSLPPADIDGYYEQLPRPKFEPIDKLTPTYTKVDTQTSRSSVKQKQMLFKPKPVAAKPLFQPQQQISQTQFKQHAPTEPTRYYTAVTGPPQHIVAPQPGPIATETSNLMQMRETTETCNRVVNMAQTKRVIQFDGRNRNIRLPTPTKFIPVSEWRESDYESELESTEIRPLWTPNQSDSEQRPQYRRVSAPRQMRAASVPKSYGSHERILTPMEFDNQPILMPNKIIVKPNQQQSKPSDKVGREFYHKSQTLDRYSSKKMITNSNQFGIKNKMAQDDIDLRPSSPPEYGFMPASSVVVNNVQRQMKDMNSTFKSKATQFLQDTIVDAKKSDASKPFYQKSSCEKTTDNDEKGPQAYRDETRCSEYGK